MSAKAETALYVHSVLKELAELTDKAGMSVLTYLLEVAKLEAISQSHGPVLRPPKPLAPSH